MMGTKTRTWSVWMVLLHLIGMATCSTSITLYIGSYTSRIARVKLDSTGAMWYIGDSPSEPNPSWLTFNQRRDILFAVSEIDDYGNPNFATSGAISSYTIEHDGSLSIINTVASGGAAPAHVVTDASDRFLYISNYCSGSIGVVEINSNSSLNPPSQVIEHNDSPQINCEGAHVHEVVLSGINDSTIEVMDLGLNSIYHYQTFGGAVHTPPQQIVSIPLPGSGPRHMVVHPNAPWAFVINELVSTISTLPYDRVTGKLGEVSSTISSLRPDENATEMAGAELQISQDGKFLYASNRDISEPNLHRSSIAVFAIDYRTGMLSTLQITSSMGEHPRFFDLYFDGTLLVVANMNSNNLVSFTVDKTSGLISPPSPYFSDNRILKMSKPTHILPR